MLLRWWRRLVHRPSRRAGRALTLGPLNAEVLEERVLLSTSVRPVHEVVGAPGHAGPLGYPKPNGLQPAQVRHAYQLDQILFGGSVVGDGTGQTIAIVDAYDDPTVASDLALFDTTFGIAAPPSFTEVNQTGGSTLPPPDKGWALEISLDVQWAHALAPGASILLVEANSASNSDMYAAVDYARNQPGVSVISMSWGEPEYATQTQDDAHFTTPTGHAGVTFVAATGDHGAPGLYPAYSPNVVAAGGTYLKVSGNSYVSETGWSGGGGGISKYEAQPAYQNGVVTQSTTARTIPDVAFNASNPEAVADSYTYGSSTPWVGVVGTSAAAPAWAALLAIANQGRVLQGEGTLDGFNDTLPLLYQLPAGDWHDITTGNNGYPAGPGYDLVTGIGSPVANLVAYHLAHIPVTRTWTGGGATTNWSDPGNWGGTAPVAGDSLVFGSGATQLTSTNDFAPGTQFNSVTLGGSGYTIGGNGIALIGGLDASAATGANAWDVDTTLISNQTLNAGSGAAALTVGGNLNTAGFTLTVAGGNGSVEVDGAVSGSGGLVENNAGTLILGGSPANTYTGATLVEQGTLLLSKSAGNAVGGPLTVGGGSATALARLTASNQLGGAAVTVASPGTLDLNGNSDAVGTLTLNGGTVTTEAGTLTLGGGVTDTGTSSISGNLALGTGAGAFTVNASGTLTVSAAIGGAAGLTASGPGTLVLSGANTYGGGTTLAGGTLSLGTSSALGTGTLTLNGGILTASGGALSLANALTVGGNVTFGGSNALTFGGPVTLTGSRTLTVNNSSTTLAGAVGESGGSRTLTKAGTGKLVLSGSNTYTGGTVLGAGTLALDNASSAGTGTLTLNAGTLRANSTALSLANPVTLGGSVTLGGGPNLTLTGTVTLTGNRTLTMGGGTMTLAGTVTQSGGTWALTEAGSGTLALTGSNTYAGGTVLSAGTLALGNANSAGTGTLTLSGGTTLQATGAPVSLANAVTVGGNVTLGGSLGLTLSGPVTLTGSRTVTVTNTGTTTLARAVGQSGGNWSLTKAGAGTLVLSGSNTYAGGTVLGAGTLALDNASSAGTGTLTLNGGTLQANSAPLTLANPVTLGNATLGGSFPLTLSGPVTLTGSRTVTVTNTGTTTLAGAVGQSGGTWSLTKAGAGTLVLAGTNTYAGGTAVSAGTLLVNGSQGAGAVTVAAGATLGGSGTTGPVSVKSGGTLLPGAGTGSPAVLNTGNLTLSSGSTFTAALNGTTAGSGYGQADVTGTVTLTGSTLNVALGFTPDVGTTFVLINNDGAGAVVGTFGGLAEGATFVQNGMTFRISYKGGDGNDVTLTRIA
jgi:autotransporter-associated beta strand protein